ncbi:MAG TPA: DnaJ family domain-containing protein [Acidimicrobiia bacterium]|nr:DnaJ family domain-containing protein [Acidimicrobiia bacterium]
MKPEPLEPYETLPERLIREAMESGEFDELSGVGKPLPSAGATDDDLWWVREWVKRNREEGRGEWNSA